MLTWHSRPNGVSTRMSCVDETLDSHVMIIIIGDFIFHHIMQSYLLTRNLVLLMRVRLCSAVAVGYKTSDESGLGHSLIASMWS